MTAREKRFKPGSLGRRMDPTKRPKAPGLATRPPKKVKKDQIKQRLKRMALGGEAAESVGKATVERSQRAAKRKLLDDSINRVYKKVSEAKKIGKIKPKKKPKNPNRIKPKKKPKKP